MSDKNTYYVYMKGKQTMKTYTCEELQNIIETIVTSDCDGWHVYFPKGRRDFLSGIADGGTAFHYYEGREDNLKWVDYDTGFVSFYNGKPRGFLRFWARPRKGDGDYPLWIKEYDWRDRWYRKDYEIGEHNYSMDGDEDYPLWIKELEE